MDKLLLSRERLTGSQEVGGSTPLGSTLETSALRGFSSFGGVMEQVGWVVLDAILDAI